MVSQATVDTAIVNLVVGAILPLRIVEVAELQQLISTLQPDRHVLGGKAVRKRIDADAKS